MHRKTFEVYKRPKEAKYKWRHWLQFVLAFWSSSFGLSSLVGLPLLPNQRNVEAGDVFIGGFLVIWLVLAPLTYLLTVIGQYSGQGPLQSFKLVPVTFGVGIAITAFSAMTAILKSITVSRAASYFVLTFIGVRIVCFEYPT